MNIQMTAAEELMMQCLWESGEDLTVYEMTERLRLHYGKDYANNAVATFMKNLYKRGLVSRYKKHHSYQWHSEIDMEAYRDQKLGELRDQWYHGSENSLLASLIKTSDISEEDIRKMKELLDGYIDPT